MPDILANAGGVVVSYLEWVQDLQNFFWEEEEVNRQLNTIMVRSFRDVWDFSLAQDVPLRLGGVDVGRGQGRRRGASARHLALIFLRWYPVVGGAPHLRHHTIP